jgi:hypothetical protein
MDELGCRQQIADRSRKDFFLLLSDVCRLPDYQFSMKRTTFNNHTQT